MRPMILAAALFLIDVARSAAAPPTPQIEYTIALPAPQTQMVDIAIDVRKVEGESIEFALPVWRPGKYQVLDPAGTVREVRAFAGPTGANALQIEKIDKSTWRVATEGAERVVLRYRVYANSLADRTRHIDDTHAFISPAAVLMYVRQRRHEPLLVHVDAPREWRIACGLEALPNDARTLTAANYDILVDSPLEIGVHELVEFEARGALHQIAIWGKADYDPGQLIADFAKIVEMQAAIFGSVPYQRFVFITHLVGSGTGGGTEHLNSTVIQASRDGLEEPKAYKRFLGLVSHEMFHTWNVKQFRPAGIHPYDYQQENYSKLLWVAEGTTSYYDELTLVRAGLVKPDSYLKTIGDQIDVLRKRPGAFVQSLEESSFDAWIKFNKPTADSVNSTVSFYDKGAMVSLLLDLTIRLRTGHTRSLDDVMRALYQQFPLNGPGYEPEDLLRLIEDISGGKFDEFFNHYVRGTEPLVFDDVLSGVGLELHFKPNQKDDEDDDHAEGSNQGDRRPDAAVDQSDDEGDAVQEQADAEADDEGLPEDEPAELIAYLGLNLADQDGRTTVRSVLSDGPAYEAGVLAGDEVVALDDRRLTAADFAERLKLLEPGQTIALTLFRRDELRVLRITLTGRPDGAWKLRRVKEPSDQQKAAYKAWLGQEWPQAQ